MRHGNGWIIGNIELRFNEGKQRFKLSRRGTTERNGVDFELTFFELLTILAAIWMCIRRCCKGDFEKFIDLTEMDIDLEGSVESAKKFMAEYVGMKLVGVPLVPYPNNFHIGNVLKYTSFDIRFLVPVEEMVIAGRKDLPSIPLDTPCLISSRTGGPLELCPDELFFLSIVTASDIFSTMETLVEEDERKKSGRRRTIASYIFGGILQLGGMPHWAYKGIVRTLKYRSILADPKVKPNVKMPSAQHQMANTVSQVARRSSEALEPLFTRIAAAVREQDRREEALQVREAGIIVREEESAKELVRRAEALTAQFADEKARLAEERRALDAEKLRIGEESAALSAAQTLLQEERIAFETDLAQVAEIPGLRHTIEDLTVKNATLLHRLGQKALR